MAEVVPSWHDFNMTGQKSCLIGTTSAYEVVPNWHDLPKFVFFLNGPHFGKNKKNNFIMVKKPFYVLKEKHF